jgi:hypothetical protein
MDRWLVHFGRANSAEVNHFAAVIPVNCRRRAQMKQQEGEPPGTGVRAEGCGRLWQADFRDTLYGRIGRRPFLFVLPNTSSVTSIRSSASG